MEEIREARDIILCISNPLELALMMNEGFLKKLNFENTTQLMDDGFLKRLNFENTTQFI